MTIKNNTKGVMWALMIPLTAAIALPLVNIFTTLLPSDLMTVRGGVTCVAVGLFFFKNISYPRPNVILFSVLFGVANLMLYMGIRTWGVSPTITVLTAMPVVNIAAARWRGNTVKTRTYLTLFVLVLGVAIAINPWQTEFNAVGCAQSIAATIFAGVGVEVLAGTKEVDKYNRTFWLAAVILVIGLVVTLARGIVPFGGESFMWTRILQLVAFGLIAGFLYFLSNIHAFDKLKTETASTLAMAETPATILSSMLILDEERSPVQWAGVGIALIAVLVLGGTEVKASESPNTT